MIESQRQKPTIYDLARVVGVSPSTVSSVLNGTWQGRRISENTAHAVMKSAQDLGYSTNLQARGLRKARSGMVGMIVPVHDNRFFSSISQSFEAYARERGWCPVIASTLRDPAEELRTVETLISYAVDSLFITGATNPDALMGVCKAANIPHVYIDLPGPGAPSVVSDNLQGAEALTRTLLKNMSPSTGSEMPPPYFVGGVAKDFATARRIEGFRRVLQAEGIPLSEEQIIPCGYAPSQTTLAIGEIYQRLGGLPSVLFINSMTAFEGALSKFVDLPGDAFANCQIGCYDYDPFSAFLQFPVYMVRQNADRLISEAFKLIDAGETEQLLIEIEPDLIPPKTIYKGRFGGVG